MQNKIFASRLEELEAENHFKDYDFFQEENGEERASLVLADEEKYEGQLAVDVYQDKKNIYIKSAIAGVRAEDIEIHLNSDTLTIKGKRQIPETTSDEDYFVRECYWGGFSRSIILPVDVKQDQVRAAIHNGILTITLPKSKRARHSSIPVREIKE